MTEPQTAPGTAEHQAADLSPEGPALVELPLGKGLSAQAASAVLREAFTGVILVAGTAKSGKTTLLASLYLLFQKGPFAGYLFAESKTLVGFENRNYFALCASKGVKPKTPRTTISEHLHLQVRREDLSEPVRSLLLCDLSGEDFREAKDSSEACKRLEIIRRADFFVLLVDGEKLRDPTSRKRAKNDPMTLLRNCLDNGMLGARSAVDVLFTKWDLVEASPGRDEIVSFAEYIEGEFRSQFGGRLRALRTARVAAHPFESNLPLGHGLEGLFPSWAESFLGEGRRTRWHPLTEPEGLPEYDRYLRRRLPHLFAGG